MPMMSQQEETERRLRREYVKDDIVDTFTVFGPILRELKFYAA